MLPNIKDHSIVVARVAEVIAAVLNLFGHQLSLDKIIAGALLHDIGKTSCLDNDEDHAAKGVEICMAHNFGTIADIVGEHVILRNYTVSRQFTEKEIVYYADKRVSHDQVVSLEERLAYILERYGMNNVVRCEAIKRNYALCRKLEKSMFSFLPFEPFDIPTLLTTRESPF
ncbi:MAG: HDIG domain-containing protein [Deltaproteobacteria bacterium]|nr:HDIG domain-containing protein [Deltaproteobacteria bacterium]